MATKITSLRLDEEHQRGPDFADLAGVWDGPGRPLKDSPNTIAL